MITNEKQYRSTRAALDNLKAVARQSPQTR